MHEPPIVPVILSGGAGTRLWPVSREALPKPFIRLGGIHSLLQRTLLRAAPLAAGGRIAIVTGSEQYFRTREELRGLPAGTEASVMQLLEPVGRNTAPAVALAAPWAEERAPGATDDRIEIDAERFARCPDVSLDRAVMEKADNAVVLPADFGWSDIGSWKSVAEQLPADTDGNTCVGEAMLVGTSGTHVQSEDRLVAAVGVENLLIVDTPDALLVASKDASQQVREVVERMKARNHESARLHRTVARPWGAYTVLQEGPRFKIKRIEVRPGESLSLQMHHHRSEHWIVVSGTARVTSDERSYLVSANESTYIPIGTKHRLENPGVLDLVMIEVQCGDYLGEDDIVRFSDVYGRTGAAPA